MSTLGLEVLKEIALGRVPEPRLKGLPVTVIASGIPMGPFGRAPHRTDEVVILECVPR